ncbi:hypothetical protein Psal110_00523 [Piscirickettsia salmonis]|uniref:hypothetical protein n=1 Tax=Piscirickettsia salmonis TaxID=1238 RepID=UPI0012BA7CA2|nr:hypothetical protein [Piscirickettsia salmonis]QGO89972.1 hypothetical protein Psal110_00523 [Piscirickettsia salmonis]
MKNILSGMLVATALTATYSIASVENLSQCGKVIAHENGWVNFDPAEICHGLNTCPEQLAKMTDYNSTQPASKQLHFVKMSLRRLSDGSWVISHNESQPILVKNTDVNKVRGMTGVHCAPSVKGYNLCLVKLAALSSSNFSTLQTSYGLDVYRLSDYTNEDKANNFCYMLYFKVDPNQNILNDLYNLGINKRVLLESRDNQNDATWIQNNQQVDKPIYYTGRVFQQSDIDYLQDNKATFPNMWAVEISYGNWKNLQTIRSYVQQVNKMGFKTELDSMDYASGDEVKRSYCDVPLKGLGASVTMTSNPLNCLTKVRNNLL